MPGLPPPAPPLKTCGESGRIRALLCLERERCRRGQQPSLACGYPDSVNHGDRRGRAQPSLASGYPNALSHGHRRGRRQASLACGYSYSVSHGNRRECRHRAGAFAPLGHGVCARASTRRAMLVRVRLGGRGTALHPGPAAAAPWRRGRGVRTRARGRCHGSTGCAIYAGGISRRVANLCMREEEASMLRPVASVCRWTAWVTGVGPAAPCNRQHAQADESTGKEVRPWQTICPDPMLTTRHG